MATHSTFSDRDAASLSRELASNLRGEVRFDQGSRALYATDASNYRQVPIGVVLPRDRGDLLAAIDICRRHDAPIVTRGGGTSLAGQACNVAVVLDTSKYFNRVLEVDSQRRVARVEPGAVLDDLQRAAKEHGLTFGPDPASHAQCTLGGMIGNDSCGVHSVMAAFWGEGPRTADNIEELEIATYDGVVLRVGRTSEEDLARAIASGGRRAEIHTQLAAFRDRYAPLVRTRFPNVPRRVSGYNLPYLLPERGFHIARALTGSEGTCVTVLEATVQLLQRPKERALAVMGFPDVYAAARAVPEILAHRPVGLEGFDNRLVSDTRAVGSNPEGLALLPEGGGWLLVEFGGATVQEARSPAEQLAAQARRLGALAARICVNSVEEAAVWKVRESALGVTSHVPGRESLWEGWEDSAVAPERLADYMRDLRQLLDAFGYDGSFYGHFGQGCLHTRLNFDFRTPEGVAKFRRFLDEAADLVVSYGGSLSGEHGDGQARAELLPKMFGDEIVNAFREFKRIWDPDGKMNPGKVVEPYGITDNLRLRSDRRPQSPPTHFSFAEDHGLLERAVQRCVGVGKCRRLEGGSMCPSFMATREEEHSTRGRAHLLFEMLRGETIQGGWKNEDVRRSLDLCLACKACKSECPVGVDVATYKAEFLSHYYARRLRPRAAYAMGLIHRWARLASAAPGAINLMTQAPLLSSAVRRLAGISSHRQLPRLAGRTFRRWFRERPGTGTSRRASASKRVIVWPDTFHNFFQPAAAEAAVEVLEAGGFDVALPERDLCCGRPLYDFGMLATAKGMLAEILHTLRDEIRQGTPIVVLEPSCASVFQNELPNLFPEDPDAARLKALTFLLPEFLTREAGDLVSGSLSGRAIHQTHCHQKALAPSSALAERAALQRLGLTVDEPNDGCCGMAGAFGFESGHYGISLQIAERALAPALRQASAETLLVADGFSCREQIRHLTGRTPLHFAQVLHRAMAPRA